MADYRDPTPLEPSYLETILKKVNPIILKYTKSIREKMYGKDVRESIARAIELSGEESGEALHKSKIIGERLDNQLKELTSESELIDLRYSEIFDRHFNVLKDRGVFWDEAIRDSGLRADWFIDDFNDPDSVRDGINTALTQARAFGIHKVRLSDRVYRATGPILVPTMAKLYGGGSNSTRLLILSPENNGISVYDRTTNVTLEGFSLEAAEGYTEEGSGIFIQGNKTLSTDRLTIRDVRVFYFRSSVRNEAALWNSIFEEVRLTKSKYSIYSVADYTLTWTFLNCYFDEPEKLGIYAEGGSSFNLVTCSFGAISGIASGFITLTNRSGLTATECNFENCTIPAGKGAIKVLNDSKLTLVSCSDRKNESSEKDLQNWAYFIQAQNNAKVYAVSVGASSGPGRVKPVSLADSSKLVSPDNSLYQPVILSTVDSPSISISTAPQLKRLKIGPFNFSDKLDAVLLASTKAGILKNISFIMETETGAKNEDLPVFEIKQGPDRLTTFGLRKNWYAKGHVEPITGYANFTFRSTQPIFITKPTNSNHYGNYSVWVEYEE